MRRRTMIAAIALLGVLAAACDGDTTVHTGTAGEGISVSGVGRVAVEPDVAIVSLGVEVQATTVSRARSDAAEAMQDVRDSLADSGVEDIDIQTWFFNIFPQFDFDRRTPEITGFTVSNQVEIKVRHIDSVSDVLDDAIAAGGGRHPRERHPLRRRRARAVLRRGAPAGRRGCARARRAACRPRGREPRRGDVDLESSGGGIPAPLQAFDARAEAFGGTSIAPGEGEIVLTVFVLYGVE